MGVSKNTVEKYNVGELNEVQVKKIKRESRSQSANQFES